MKLTKTANGTKITLTPSEWLAIGKKKNWTTAQIPPSQPTSPQPTTQDPIPQGTPQQQVRILLKRVRNAMTLIQQLRKDPNLESDLNLIENTLSGARDNYLK